MRPLLHLLWEGDEQACPRDSDRLIFLLFSVGTMTLRLWREGLQIFQDLLSGLSLTDKSPFEFSVMVRNWSHS
jgi:hypothetical protein